MSHLSQAAHEVARPLTLRPRDSSPRPDLSSATFPGLSLLDFELQTEPRPTRHASDCSYLMRRDSRLDELVDDPEGSLIVRTEGEEELAQLLVPKHASGTRI